MVYQWTRSRAALVAAAALALAVTAASISDAEGAPGGKAVIEGSDEEPPVLICPPDTIVECDTEPGIFGYPEVYDNCDPDPAVEYRDEIEIGSRCPQDRLIRRTWIARDAAGNVSACMQRIAFIDTTPPVITAPDTVDIDCVVGIPGRYEDDIQAADNCGEAVLVWVRDIRPGGFDSGGSGPFELSAVETEADESLPLEPLPCGANSEKPYCIQYAGRVYKAVDECCNEAEHLIVYKVFDKTPPEIQCPEGGVVSCASEIPEPDVSVVTASDICHEVRVTHLGDESDGRSCPETITRTYQAMDECCNVSQCTQVFVIDDQVPPVIACPGSIHVECGGEIPPPDIGLVEAEDNCGGPVFIEHVSDIALQAGKNLRLATMDGQLGVPENGIIRTYRATDECGNPSECTQIITIEPCDQPCTFSMWDWGACCPEDEAQNPQSTYPACVRDRYFQQIFPDGVSIGDTAGVYEGDPGYFAALWTSSQAVQDFLPAFGTPGPLTGDLVDPVWTEAGALAGHILTLRLNREYSHAGVFAELCFTDVVVPLGDYVIPQTCGVFAGLTVDEFLAIGDQVIAGNLGVLDFYGASPLDVKVTAQCLNYELSGCVPDCGVSSVAETYDVEGLGNGLSVAGESGLGSAPVRFIVYQSFPNPFGTRANIRFGLPAEGLVTMEVFNATGRRIAVVMNERRPPGFHTVTWNGRDDRGYMVPSGVYFYRVKSGGHSDVKKMILSR